MCIRDRLKTDQAVIGDLPDKIEQNAYCGLSRKQAALYQQAVSDLTKALDEGVEGVARKGLVLAFLTRFKQICNHPSHWLGDGGWAESDSGKLARLRELAEGIAANAPGGSVVPVLVLVCVPPPAATRPGTSGANGVASTPWCFG